MLLKHNQISTNMFHYDPEDKVFSQEVSSLRGFKTGPIYDDACDEGFTLVSHKTGKEEVVCLSEIDRNEDNEVCGWWFEPVNTRLNFKVLIIND